MKEKRHDNNCIIVFVKSLSSKKSQCLWIKDTSFNKYKTNKSILLGDSTNIICKKLTSNTKYGYRGQQIESNWFDLFLKTYA